MQTSAPDRHREQRSLATVGKRDTNEIGQYLEGQKRIYIDLYSQPSLLQSVLQQTQTVIRKKRGNIGPTQFFHIDEILGPMRLVKTENDLLFIRKAIEITNKSHRAAMAFAEPGKKEYEVQALIEFLFRKQGANGEAYGSIVAGGANANILHYVSNNDTLRDCDLLLIDAGCEYGYYASDVTRTFPINGKFSSEQKIIYELVLQSQLKCIEISKPGVTLEQIHQTAVKVLVSGLIDLKFLSGSVDEVIANESYKKFYPHRTGHWLGLDVHDLGPYRTSDGNDFVKTIPGMIYTIEPGLYIPADAQEAPPAFRGIGIRTEDDILITDTGFENLTKAIPKTISEIENACTEDYRKFLIE